MRDFVILTDSCCDLPIEYVKEKKIPFVSLTCRYDGKEYFDDFGQSLSHEQFYEDLRKGHMPMTSQPNVDAFYDAFKNILDEEKDIIYVGVSSGLSGTNNSANIARKMILEEYKEAEIYILDTLTASLGQGLMVMEAYDKKEKGESKEEIVAYLQENIKYLNTFITVDDLSYLKKGGRISATAAILGIVLHVKPIIMVNEEGKVDMLEKVKGRKKAIDRVAQFVKERIKDAKGQRIAICHGDCIEEAIRLRDRILEWVEVKEAMLHYVGPVVGSFGGPGALAVFFKGESKDEINNEL